MNIMSRFFIDNSNKYILVLYKFQERNIFSKKVIYKFCRIEIISIFALPITQIF